MFVIIPSPSSILINKAVKPAIRPTGPIRTAYNLGINIIKFLIKVDNDANALINGPRAAVTKAMLIASFLFSSLMLRIRSTMPLSVFITSLAKGNNSFPNCSPSSLTLSCKLLVLLATPSLVLAKSPIAFVD